MLIILSAWLVGSALVLVGILFAYVAIIQPEREAAKQREREQNRIIARIQASRILEFRNDLDAMSKTTRQ